MKALFINEVLNFERGKTSKKEIIDVLTDRIIELDLPAASVSLDENDNPDLTDEDTKYLVDTLEENGVKYKMRSMKKPPYQIYVTISGTRKQIIPVLTLWDPYSRTGEELEKALEGWGKDNLDDLYDFLEKK